MVMGVVLLVKVIVRMTLVALFWTVLLACGASLVFGLALAARDAWNASAEQYKEFVQGAISLIIFLGSLGLIGWGGVKAWDWSGKR